MKPYIRGDAPCPAKLKGKLVAYLGDHVVIKRDTAGSYGGQEGEVVWIEYGRIGRKPWWCHAEVFPYGVALGPARLLRFFAASEIEVVPVRSQKATPNVASRKQPGATATAKAPAAPARGSTVRSPKPAPRTQPAAPKSRLGLASARRPKPPEPLEG